MTIAGPTAIIGTGVIGTGWAARLLAHGHEVVAFDPSPGFESRLKADLENLWPTLEKSGVTPKASMDLLTCVTTLQEACQGASFIQESAPENIELKTLLHRQIDENASDTAIVASSSSGLLPSDIQKAHRHPERMLIGHPFNPVYLLPLVEIVGSEATSPDVIAATREYYESINMHPLVVRKEIEGYLSDRLQEALWREALHLVNDGVATTQELDDAIIYGPGLRWAVMGTCLTFHLAGGNGGMAHMLEQFGPALKLPWTHLEAPELTPQLIQRMVEGTQDQAAGESVESLAQLRDDCLIEIMAALAKFETGAGRLHAQRQNSAKKGD